MTSTQFEPRAGFHAAHLPVANASPRIRVFVVHNHPAYRFGLVSVLESESSLLCVGEAADLAEAVHTAAMLAPSGRWRTAMHRRHWTCWPPCLPAPRAAPTPCACA